MNIDFDFIAAMEGFELKGYVPDASGSNSGVTIASGFDISQRSEGELLAMLGSELASKLIPYIGKTKFDAVEFLASHPLEVTKEEAEKINKAAHAQALDRLAIAWNECASCEFSSLPANKATAVASVAFQYGSLAKRTPNFWRQVTSGDWPGALSNLRNFGDKYSTRRNKEADLLEGKA